MHHIGALPGLSAKLLAEEIGNIRLIAHNQDADGHADPPCASACLLLTWQSHRELGELAKPAIDLNRAAMLLRDDVVGDRQPQTGALACRLGREEWLKQLIPNVGRYAGPVVADPYLDRIPGVEVRVRDNGTG